MPYEHVEHISDIGIRASGATVEEAFEAGAEAMLSIMYTLATVGESWSIDVKAEAPDVEMLFVEVLNELLYVQGRNCVALKRLKVRSIEKTADGWRFEGEALGEKVDPGKQERGTEVKGATYSGLKYEVKDGVYALECVLDV